MDLKALAAEISLEQMVELIARYYAVNEIDFCKSVISDAILQGDQESIENYTNTMANKRMLIEAVQTTIENANLDVEVDKAVKKIAGEYTEPR